MRRLSFKEMSMLSFREKKARKIEFHPRMTVIKGGNDTGKSALMKTIYRTLGAEPHQIHPEWEDTSVSSLLTFEIDKTTFRMLRTGEIYCIFDEKGNLLKRFSSVTKDIAPFFAELFNFKLPLNSRKEQMQATPAFLFLPFYFDQDRSWQEQWNGFNRLSQFTNWKNDLITFHCGIRPTEFYLAKSEKLQKESEQNDCLSQRKVIANTLERLKKELHQVRFDIDIDNYKAEIETLIKLGESLRIDEEALKKKLVSLYNKKHSLQHQKSIVDQSLKEIEKDYNFATIGLHDEVECPTCGQVYMNTLAERFAIAQDEHRCRDLLIEITSAYTEIERELTALDNELAEIRAKTYQIQELLEEKKGELKLRDVIQSEGRKEVKLILHGELTDWDNKIGKLQSAISVLEETMSKYDNKDRKKQIWAEYFERIKKYMFELHVLKLREDTYRKIDCVIKETGSDLPRALLAYYYAVLGILFRYSTSTFCPIVLDSPKQQDIDDENWRRMLMFIKSHQPADSQTILSLVDNQDINMGGREIILDKKYSVLLEEEFNEVSNEMGPYLDACVHAES